MNKLILLDQFYAKPENAKWEERRYKVLKELASKTFKERNAFGPFMEFNIPYSGLHNCKLCADKILALINPEIASLVTKNKFKVTMKKKPKNYEEYSYFYRDLTVDVRSYDDLPTLAEIKSAFHAQYHDFKVEDAETYTIDDFEIQPIDG